LIIFSKIYFYDRISVSFQDVFYLYTVCLLNQHFKSLWTAVTPMHFCPHMCFFKQHSTAKFFSSASPMPIRTKSRALPFSGADTAFPFLISAGYF
jgi:hypothetical protein